MTCATIDITALKINFHADAAAGRAHADADDELFVGSPDDLGELSGPQMVALYNATADLINDGTGQSLTHTKRFPNKEAGIKRLMANITDLFELEREAAKRKPAPVKRAVTPGKEVWRRKKHEDASKVAYRPRPGTVQGGLYELLVDGGMKMEDYCEKASKLNTRDATLFTPAAVWSALRYLFVANRGYGLDFDGVNIKLIVPEDERQQGENK